MDVEVLNEELPSDLVLTSFVLYHANKKMQNPACTIRWIKFEVINSTKLPADETKLIEIIIVKITTVTIIEMLAPRTNLDNYGMTD